MLLHLFINICFRWSLWGTRDKSYTIQLQDYRFYGKLSNVKINNSDLTRFNFESGVVYFCSPKQAGLDQVTILFDQHMVGELEFCFSLCAPMQRAPSLILVKRPSPTRMFTVTHQNHFAVLGIRDHSKKKFLKSLCPSWAICLVEIAALSADLFLVQSAAASSDDLLRD